MSTTPADMRNNLERLRKRFEREREARISAEVIAEQATRELYEMYQELMEKEALSHALVEQAVEAFIVCDVDGTVMNANKRACTNLGTTQDDILGQQASEIILLNNHQSVVTLIASLTPKAPVRVEARHRRKDGSTFPIRLSCELVLIGNKHFVTCYCEDLTEIKRAHSAIRRSEERERAIFTSSLDAMITVDENGRIQAANPAALEMFGFKSGELRGMSMKDLIPSLFTRLLETKDTSIVAHALGTTAEYQATRKDSTTFPVELSLSELVARSGHEIVAVIRDISERREVERAKSQFVSTVSHELRTPIASIRGALGILASHVFGDLPSKAKELIQLAERNSVRLINLINDILDHQRLQTGRLELVLGFTDSQSILESSLEAVQEYAAQNQVQIDLCGTNIELEADTHRISQVLVNFLSNAVKFSEAGGRITVRTQQVDGIVEIRVIDTGRGVPQEHLESIFEPFQQVDASDAREKGGTGLGLSICRGIVKQHGGEIGVESVYGEGSEFWLRLAIPEYLRKAQ